MTFFQKYFCTPEEITLINKGYKYSITTCGARDLERLAVELDAAIIGHETTLRYNLATGIKQTQRNLQKISKNVQNNSKKRECGTKRSKTKIQTIRHYLYHCRSGYDEQSRVHRKNFGFHN